MKVFNLTDIETPALKQRGLLNQTFAVGDKLLAPGASDEVDDETLERVRPELQNMVALGIAALGDVPSEYTAKKAAAQDKKTEAKEAPASSDSEVETPSPPAKRGR